MSVNVHPPFRSPSRAVLAQAREARARRNLLWRTIYARQIGSAGGQTPTALAGSAFTRFDRDVLIHSLSLTSSYFNSGASVSSNGGRVEIYAMRRPDPVAGLVLDTSESTTFEIIASETAEAGIIQDVLLMHAYTGINDYGASKSTGIVYESDDRWVLRAGTWLGILFSGADRDEQNTRAWFGINYEFIAEPNS